MSGLGVTLKVRRNYRASELRQVEFLDAMTRVLGEDHPYTLIVMINLAPVLRYQGKCDQAEEISQMSLAKRKP